MVAVSYYGPLGAAMHHGHVGCCMCLLHDFSWMPGRTYALKQSNILRSFAPTKFRCLSLHLEITWQSYFWKCCSGLDIHNNILLMGADLNPDDVTWKNNGALVLVLQSLKWRIFAISWVLHEFGWRSFEHFELAGLRNFGHPTGHETQKSRRLKCLGVQFFSWTFKTVKVWMSITKFECPNHFH